MATQKKTKSSGGRVFRIPGGNMKGVESGGSRRYPEGDYRVKIADAVPKTSQNDNPMIVLTLVITGAEDSSLEGKKLTERVTITENSRWRLANLLDALELKWSAKTSAIPLDKLQDKEFGVTVVDDEPYGGRIKSKVSDYLTLATINGILEGAEDEEEEDEDLEEEEEDDDEEVDELDVDDEL